MHLQVRISYAQRNFQTALSEKDVPGFRAALWQFVGIILLATPSFALADWLEVGPHTKLLYAYSSVKLRHAAGGIVTMLLLCANSPESN